ncbi:hypothetical protein [Fodinibius sp. Rm-B-1B1-1]|uniref:hypothetical protein n=1 Tax=Fodinibius alkaliphilus TaxID=3140241 RepID=UPI003159DE03
MQRIFYFLVILSLSGLLISCSGTGEVSQQQENKQQEVSQYPNWYPQQEFVSNDTELLAYATAIDTDSAAAVQKAKSWAIKQLESSVSDKLEEIRSEVAVEEGSGSGLEEARFLMALRKAPRAVQPLVKTKNIDTQTVEGYESVRGFTEISVPKDQLIERIGKRLGGHEKAWNLMKNSKAFAKF